MPPLPAGLTLRWLMTPGEVDDNVEAQLLCCWRDVANAGGAVGFPFIPVDDEQVRPAVEALVASLDPSLNRLLLALHGEDLAGWVLLAGNSSRLTAHWATVLRLQTAVGHRRSGVGRAMLVELARAASAEWHLDQLHLALRGGLGLERFYEECGWREVGRWPAALRLRPDDFRDEVLMMLTLR